MTAFRTLYAFIFALLSSSIWAQQLNGTQMDMGYPGLSTACGNALNTSVDCPVFLSPLSASHAILDTEQVTGLCVDSCFSSLQSARTIIQAACTASTDVIVWNNVAYPATFLVDNFLFTYNVSCRTDSSTGEFCDPQFLLWSNETYLTTAQSCSDCWLGVQALQLSNPLGYDDNLASSLASLTSSCDATAYSFTSPTAYALNTTATTAPPTVTATPPSTCTGSYTVQATDDCNSVALALNVSTYGLLYANNLDIYCQNFATAVNSTLCIPPQCKTYTWQALDSCNSVASSAGVTVPQFLTWNPNFNSLCQNSLNYVGYQVCLSPPGGYLNSTTSSTGNVTTVATTAETVPTNAMTGSNRDCGDWYTVQENDTCALLSEEFSISLQNFYFLNPEIYANCTNLDLGVAYCVEPVGNIATYSGYTFTTSSAAYTVPLATFSSVNTAIPSATSNPGYTATTSLLPTASGTLNGCNTYRNYDNSTDGVNGCTAIASAYDVTFSELLSWNPSLPSNQTTCYFQSGFSYCVLQSTLTSSNGTDNCLPINATMAGTATNCDCFTQVYGYQNTTFFCADLETNSGVSLAQLTAWNSWLGSDCDTALYANLTEDATRAVCIGVNASTATKTTSTASTTTSPTMGPTASGTVAGCQQFYTVPSGGSCSAIESMFNITFAQFYAWNPSIGSDCTLLLVGYAYCVQGPAATTTTSGPTDPTQTGIASNCDEWYNVVSGDSCSKIETTYNITFAQFYAWNPAIGSNCQSLDIGYAYCVGVS